MLHFLNVVGLTLGLSVFFLVSLYVYQENSYESDFSHKERIFQISGVSNGVGEIAYATPNLAFAQDEIPEIDAITVFSLWGAGQGLRVGESEPITMKIISADSSFLSVFDFEIIAGIRESALTNPNSIVITDKGALKAFGTVDVLGKTVELRDVPYTIEAVIRSPHFKTQLDFEVLLPKKHQEYQVKLWRSVNVIVYVRTNANSSQEQLDESLLRVSLRHVYPQVTGESVNIMGTEEWRKDARYSGFFSESIHQLRMSSDTRFNPMPRANRSQLNTMSIVGLAALIMSMINFINLSTAKASARFKEVGVKRILGSSKVWLISQFLFEAFILISFSALLALGLVELVIQVGPGYLNSFIEYSILHSAQWIWGLILSICALSLLAGIYPALYLSSGKSIALLKKGEAKNMFSILNAKGFRKGAIVLQFVCSIGLIAGVIVMFQQMDFLKNRDLGYEDEYVFSTAGMSLLVNPIDKSSSFETFKNELLKIPSIKEIGFSFRVPLDNANYIPFSIKTSDSTNHDFVVISADVGFIDLMEFKLVEGRMFDEKAVQRVNTEDGKSLIRPVVINEMAAQAMGFENPVGEVIANKYEVVGVLQDFFFDDLRKKVDPIIIYNGTDHTHSNLVVKADNMGATMAQIETIWSGLIWPGYGASSLSWNTLESRYAKLVQGENDSFRLVLLFSILAVIISCLGLLGLAVFTVDQRIHEFGIRKVLGASVTDIMHLFSLDFVKLLAVAFVVAVPVAVYAMQNWLDGFANRVSLSAYVFVITGMVTVILVLATILFQSLKAGRLNPVETLRNE